MTSEIWVVKTVSPVLNSGKAGAVGVVELDDAQVLHTVVGNQVAEHFTLKNVRRGGAPVEAVVRIVGEVDRGVRRGELDDAGTGDLVDDGLRNTRGRSANDGRHAEREKVGDRNRRGVGRGVTGVAVLDVDLDAEVRGVDVLDSKSDAGFFGRAEERERATLRKDGADLKGQRRPGSRSLARAGGCCTSTEDERTCADDGNATEDRLQGPRARGLSLHEYAHVAPCIEMCWDTALPSNAVLSR
jgi:hypothetical protein